jgi:hypothetical protein
MGAAGYAEFHRDYRIESDRAGLVVDVRYNRGGHVSQLLLEKLARRPIAYMKPRHGSPWSYPHDAVVGPRVAITNEFAGSDGDVFSHVFKLLGLGKLVGKRTWGGVIGIWPRHALVDGTVTTQPEFSFWFSDVGWRVENYGTDPDIVVEYRPQDYAAGIDPQLDKAIDIAHRGAREPAGHIAHLLDSVFDDESTEGPDRARSLWDPGRFARGGTPSPRPFRDAARLVSRPAPIGAWVLISGGVRRRCPPSTPHERSARVPGRSLVYVDAVLSRRSVRRERTAGGGNNSQPAPLHLEPLPDSGKRSRAGRAHLESVPDSGKESPPSSADLESLPRF